MFDKIFEFERALADYTGAPYAVMTDCCSHAIEMCMRYDRVREVVMTPYTYLSVPMTMHKLGIKYYYREEEWVGEYQFHGTRIWDSARRLEKNMYRPKTMQCLSFGHSKPLQLGRGGAILLDDKNAYVELSKQRSDGRDLSLSPWETQKKFKVGYHYRPTIEESIRARALLDDYAKNPQAPMFVAYPDCRQITIED